MPHDTMNPVSLFISYSHCDEQYRHSLVTHLRPLERSGLITIWYDGHIEAGVTIDIEIAARLESAQIILLLVSADFLASEYCYATEMQRAVERHMSGATRVI